MMDWYTYERKVPNPSAIPMLIGKMLNKMILSGYKSGESGRIQYWEFAINRISVQEATRCIKKWRRFFRAIITSDTPYKRSAGWRKEVEINTNVAVNTSRAEAVLCNSKSAR